MIPLLIIFLSVASLYFVSRILAADPNIISRRQIRQWHIPSPYVADVRLDLLEN